MPDNDINHATASEIEHLWEHIGDLEEQVFGPEEDSDEESTEAHPRRVPKVDVSSDATDVVVPLDYTSEGEEE